MISSYVICPQCRSVMKLELQPETLCDGTKRIVYAWRCMVCKTRIYEKVIELKRNEGNLLLLIRPFWLR